MPPTQFEQILTRLHDAPVKLVVVGAVAGLAHGLARATYDVDVCYWRNTGNIELLVDCLAPLHPALRIAPAPSRFQFNVPTVEALRDLPLDTDLGAVDLLASIAGLGDYESLLAHSEDIVLFGRSMRVLTLDGLITAKRAAGRPQDVADLLALEALRELRQRPDTAT